MAAIRENPRRVILIGLVLLVLLCLVAYLVFNIFFGPDSQVVGGSTPPATTEATTEPTATSLPAEDTPTPTRVLSAKTPTVEAEADETVEPTATTARPTPTPRTPATAAPVVSSGAAAQPGEIKNLLKNGDFEAGFDQRGVALEWEPFRNDGFQAVYTNETFPYIESGSNAQRVTIVGATQFNRYAGIYQQVEVVPGQVYTLTLHGQIRSAVGDINQSSYGYRMQYALSQTGLKNWANVPEAEWVELPWDEQPINASVTKFYSYTTTFEPAAAKITLFVRGWNKWPDQSEGQYTFDSFSLVGPSTAAAPLQTSAGEVGPGETTSASTTSATPTAGDAMIDKGLPTTGADDDPHLVQDGRFWGGLLILLLLAAGAVYRARWGY
ncbi:MAG: hypothetical protein L6R45_31875 [Anaerolineae bacterium]|nr:hypothetical protein [Anaerolineae bacterium]